MTIEAAVRHRNLLVIMLDEWRQAAAGFSGSDPVDTPNMDALASKGTVFTHAVSNYPVCSPHRAMLMSGMYPHANGVTANCNSLTTPAQQLDPDLRCWSDVLSDLGYRCGYVGKWHLDAPSGQDIARERARGRTAITWDAFTPRDRRHGFAFWDAYGSSNDHFRTLYWRTDGVQDAPADGGEVFEGWSPVHDTDAAIEFLDAAGDSDDPFALVVSYNPPHMPFHHVPDQWKKRYQDLPKEQLLTRGNVPKDFDGDQAGVADYFAMVSGVDAEIGRLVAALDDQLDETLIILTADHGEMLGSHGMMGKNTWYDESIMIPLVMRLPGVVPATENDVLISAPDLYPTMLALLGVSDDPGARIPADLHGRDLSGPIRHPGSTPVPDAALYLSQQSPWDVDAEGRWRNSRDERGIRTHRWTYVERREPHGDRLLFDIVNDPWQLTDVYQEMADDEAAIVEELQRLLYAELHRVSDPWVSCKSQVGPAKP